MLQMAVISASFILAPAVDFRSSATKSPEFDEASHFLSRISAEMSDHVSACKTSITFKVLPGKKLADADGVISETATAEQVSCVKKLVPWLIDTKQAQAMGYR